jgi:hypothetical protein
MKNPFISQVLSIQEEVKKHLPYGLETTGNLMLEFMSKSKDEQQRDTAAFIKASKKMPEIVMVFDFATTFPKPGTRSRSLLHCRSFSFAYRKNRFMF